MINKGYFIFLSKELQVKLSTTNLAIVGPRVGDFHISSSSAEANYEIHYKDGSIEYLQDNIPVSGYASVIRKVNALGKKIYFDYLSTQGYKRLGGIRDETGDLCSLRYGPGTTFSCTLFSGTMTHHINGRYSNASRYLEFSLPYPDGEQAEYWIRADHESKGNLEYCITGVTYPNGKEENMQYSSSEFSCPGTYPVGNLPAVRTMTTIDNQNIEVSNRVVDYNYDPDNNGRNYLGNNSIRNLNWDEYTDYLYTVEGDYRYAVEMTTTDNTKTVVTMQRYDKYHNLLETRRTCGANTQIEVTNYYASYTEDYEDQDPRFKLP